MPENICVTSVINTLQCCSNDNVELKRLAEKTYKKLNKSDVETLYKDLALLMLNPQHAGEIVRFFKEHVVSILSYALFDSSLEWDTDIHIRNCVALGKIIDLHPDVGSVAISYFNLHPSPFESITLENPVRKKSRVRESEVNREMKMGNVDIVEACYKLLRFSPDFFGRKWPWSMFFKKFFTLSHPKINWFCCRCVGILTGMSESSLEKFMRLDLSDEQMDQFLIQFEFSKCLEPNIPFRINENDIADENIFIDSSSSLLSHVTNVGGVFLSVYNREICEQKCSNIVEVESTKRNLFKIALAVSASKPVCLHGPVGSGKTSLVEYVALKTGRILGKSFFKIQLGDQTDSKLLLGSYICTSVPGEFVWQPGVLTQAVIEGSWILLEDIDLANLDIASVISALIENKCLSVPGYRDAIPVGPGFQIFLTQRSVTTTTGHHRKHTNTCVLLEKHVLWINIEPLLKEELIQIISTSYPVLKTISSRMVNVFNLFSLENCENLSKTVGCRLISTRDLFKWCSRAAIDFDVSSQTSALKVLQEAIDIFCCSYRKFEEKLEIAKAISSKLGILNEKGEYFCMRYKPNLSLTSDSFAAGRVTLPRNTNLESNNSVFSFTRSSVCLLEQIMCCIKLKEPALLVGETGTGKTTSVQYLAHVLGKKLVVINMNQQSDSVDLLGGYKPVDLKFLLSPLLREFRNVFCSYFNVEKNQKFLSNINFCFNEQKWDMLLKLLKKSCDAALARVSSFANISPEIGVKRKAQDVKKAHSNFLKKWTEISKKLEKLELQLKNKNALAFSFVEGSLVRAVEEGHWVLLDEINLANAETLECLSGLLESKEGSLSLLERGDKEPIKRHKDFVLFACMNPSTDIGKKDLPMGLRNRFTEFFVDELTNKNDLLLLVNNYLSAMALSNEKLENIVTLYLRICKEARLTLTDGLGHKPHFSLRSLCRALVIASKNPCGVFLRSLFEAFLLSFLTQLDAKSYRIVQNLISEYIFRNAKEAKSILNQPIPPPQKLRNKDFVQFEGYWIAKGVLEPMPIENYVLTASVRRNLKDLSRVVSLGHLPVLLQGETSVGKTSMITYLAKETGNKCVRINNHEHTDLQEYIGSYVANSEGKLVFREGVLVEAMRKGHWIILDELNLAPTDVLEALNRVLDDNRELFIPETQTTVKADPNFMLFATQNPPGAYGGRKMLSRAFRNRFVELHFNEIPPTELEVILHERCEIPMSYSKRMIAVMTDLQTRRRRSAAFAGKQGFITLRDLFRWGERYRLSKVSNRLYDWDQHLADEGYLLLAGRVRQREERDEIATVIENHMKRKIVPENLFTLTEKTSSVTKGILEKLEQNKNKHRNIVWTYNMRQLAVLVWKALDFHEPILLVGETGCGKTTICQLLAELRRQELLTVNCHMHTESSDFIGGLRPIRDRIENDDSRLFEWADGPLIKAVVGGEMFLADEISLADDSVLERLNSLLESERTLLVAEKGTDINSINNCEFIVANDNFRFIGTMNPGGDYGKKELSPALRNRFTEIWCEPCKDRADLIQIIESNFKDTLSLGNFEGGTLGLGEMIMDFVEFFSKTELGRRLTITVRDILTWVNFINVCDQQINITDAFVHGSFLTFLDGMGSGLTTTDSVQLATVRESCLQFLKKQLHSVGQDLSNLFFDNEKLLEIEYTSHKTFGIKPFYVALGNYEQESSNFCFDSSTTKFNALRLLRGMQLNKAILLEGSPGVGKTSLVMALAKCTKNRITRINLSDQTDISDLFGADLPTEDGTGGHFSWRDGPFLRALKNGDWILLDELNLASQSVLEGLNACLDHRGEIFIPELGKTFTVKLGTRLFACQNPQRQGGSRRGLPRSFLNRFTQVYIHEYNNNDYERILSKAFPSFPRDLIRKMIAFNTAVNETLRLRSFGHRGGPWEFNLRDLTRWCEVTQFLHDDVNCELIPERCVNIIYADRMRTREDKIKMCKLFSEVFGREVTGVAPVAYVTRNNVYIGDANVCKIADGVNMNVLKQEKTNLVLRKQLNVLRSLCYCVNLNWMAILVGSAASGKSSVVHTLAKLTGRMLYTLPVTPAMDTIDLLGGFEQTDFSRHLEEITKRTEYLVLSVIQKQFIKGNKGNAITLLSKWENCISYIRKEANEQTVAEISKLFLTKIESLKILWNDLINVGELNVDCFSVIEKLQNKANAIGNTVNAEGNLNAGGKFEWVDSVLVKCLRNGYWLLIDNVNLCNAAVLDRLNGVLEPNGVLTIGEKGVDKNGQVIQIKPHKDFRLFLTMDSRNGEISRAMRNRGIEICILNDDEINELDLMSLINLEGLKHKDVVEAIVNVHDFINELIIGDKLDVRHMLQSAFLISQQIYRGISLEPAFVSSILDVYLKTNHISDFNTNDPEVVITTKIKSELEKLSDSLLLHATLSTKDLEISSDLEKIRQQTSILGNHLQPSLEANVDDYNRKLIQWLLIHSYSISNKNDIKLRWKYMNEMLKRINAKSYNICNDIIREEILSSLDVEMQNNSNNNNDTPLDTGWLLDNIHIQKDSNSRNKLFLKLYFVSTKCLYEQKTERQKENLTLLQYMASVREEKQKNNIDDVIVQNFFTLLDEYDAFVLKMLKNESLLISDFETVAVLALLHWRIAFYKNTTFNIQGINITEMKTLLSNLHLHYKWFFKFSISYISKILKATPNTNLQRLIDNIGSELYTHFSLVYKMGRLYAKKSATPAPFTNENQIINNLTYEEEIKNVDLYKGRSNFNIIVRNAINNKRRRNELIEAKLVLKSGQENFNFDFNQIAINGEEAVRDSDVQILPVLDYVCSLALLTIKCRCDLTKVNENFLKNSKTVPPDLAGLLLAFDKTQEPSFYHEIKSRLFWYQIKSPSSVPKRYTKFNDLSTSLSNTSVITLPMHTPRLLYLIVDLAITDGNPTNIFNTVTLGTFRENLHLTETFRHVLWKNTRQLFYNDYDFVTCEVKYLYKEYNNVITILLKALTNDPNIGGACNNHMEITEMCLRQINNFEMKYSTHKGDLKLLKYLIHKCLNEIKNICGINNGRIEKKLLLTNLNRISNVYLILNNIKIFLYSKLPAVDHLTKIKFKKQGISEVINELEILNQSFEFVNSVYSDDQKSLHPLHFHVGQKINQLKIENEKYKKFVAVRPENINYQSVVKEISHITCTILSQQKLDNFYSESEKYFTLLTGAVEGDNVIFDQQLEKETQMFINISQNNIKTYETAIEDVLERYRIGFPDVIEPFLSTVSEYLYGYILKVSLLKKMLIRYKVSKYNIDMNHLLTNFIQFPSIPNNYQELLRIIKMCANVFKIFMKHKTEEEIENVSKTEKSTLIFIAIQEVYNLNVVISKNMEKLETKLFKHFDSLIELFVDAWTKQKDLEEARKKEKEALYKIRIKTEDEIDQEEFSQLFPNYRELDFSDLDLNELEETDKFENVDVNNLEYVEITKEDANHIINLHGQLVHNFTKTTWLNSKRKTDVPLDFADPLLKKFKIFKLILDESIISTDYYLDAEAIGSLNILTHIAGNYGKIVFESDSYPEVVQEKRLNFYKDSNTENSKMSFHVLKELENEIDILLNEWEDHPGFLTIKSIIKRIYEFSVTSPLSRFLTGFEMLLKNCHEWEQNAHSGVSLSAYIEKIVEVIICWRKIEMATWKESLNGVYDRMNDPITNWWFYIYNVTKQFIYESCLDKKELIETLRKFIFESNLAEFNGRLNLLYTFHCHAVHLEKNDRRDQYISILWNIYQYFKLYEPIVENKIKDLRSPIEKKLKDYVKIVKWKDISYWAIKETCEKTHKTLFKHMKQFEKALSSPVKLFLVNVTSQIINEENVGIWDRPQRQVPKNYHYTIDSSNYVAKCTTSKKISSDEQHSKSYKYFSKSRTFCKEVIDTCRYPVLIKALDCFIVEIIERSTHLQNIQVDTSLPKNKQKSNMKSILQQKRKALSDLFKNLTKIGLSYKTGLVIENNSNDLDDYFLIKPIDLSASLKQFPQSHYNEKITTIWEGCETYYIRSLIRLNLLKNTLSKPAPDLGAQNVERCRGFATHLVESIQNQKTKVIDSFETLYNIRNCKIYLTDICEKNFIFPTHVLETMKDCLANVIITMEQYQMYLFTAPCEPLLDTDLQKNTPVLLPEPTDFIRYKEDECWKRAMCLVREIQDKAQKLLSYLKHCDNSDFNLFALHDTQETTSEFNTIANKITSLFSIIGDIPLSDALKHRKAEIKNVCNQLVNIDYDLTKTNETVTLDEFAKTIKEFEKSILLSVQKIYKKYEEDIKKYKDKSLENLELNDNHLKTLLLEKLDDDIGIISMKNILTDIHKVISNINSMDRKTIFEIKPNLSKTFPILEQVLLLYQYFITQQVLTYRITSKLTSIILNIFIDLLTKGFCTPLDLLDEQNKEGEGEGQNGGFGLAEGQGEKDVSERIESEDQLDDAKPAGKENEKDDDNQPNKEEEKGIEMSEDFDADLQDIERNKEDEESNDDSDAEEQMGDVDKGADRVDQQLWGSDEENDKEEDENDAKDEVKEETGGGGEKLGEEQMGTEAGEEDSTGNEKKKQKPKDIDNFQEPEIDDDQIDPYHGNHPQYPEPEALDLPDDFGLDEDDNDNEKEKIPEENPFDIDTMKDQLPAKDTQESNDQQDSEKEKNNLEDEESGNEMEDEKTEDEIEDEEIKEKDDDKLDKDKLEKDENQIESEIESSEMKDEDTNIQSGPDQNQSAEDKTQPMEIDNSTDNVQATDMKTAAESQENRDTITEEEMEDKEGIGQSQAEKSKTGHKTPANAFEDNSNSKQDESEKEKKRKPGEADSERSLGDIKEPVKKKLKTLNNSNETREEEHEEEKSYEQQTEIYKHIKETKKATEQTLDFATDEQIQQQQEEIAKLEEEDEIGENIKELDNDEEETDVLDQIEKCHTEQTESGRKKDKNAKEKSEGNVSEEASEINVEGDVIETLTANRAAETTYYTQDIPFNVTEKQLNKDEIARIRIEVENQLSAWNEVSSGVEAERIWEKISSVTTPLAQNLCEQLRLILEPTQASQLKGDYRTGKRINMMKVIPYIASQFRKDKIWLRRTKPSKRDYQIVLAIDDSSSMSDNRSKELAFESVSLISKALSLLESGQLSILGFGEDVDILHKLGDTFSEKNGSNLIQKFTFAQKKTCIAKLVNFTTEMLAVNPSSSSAQVARLLIIVSDGRGIFWEGENQVQQAVRRAKLADIFMIFVIIDNPQNKDSILDIRMPIFNEGKLLEIKSYMDSFPFPFYIILKDINSLPDVLSDALRQWFEIVINNSKI